MFCCFNVNNMNVKIISVLERPCIFTTFLGSDQSSGDGKFTWAWFECMACGFSTIKNL